MDHNTCFILSCLVILVLVGESFQIETDKNPPPQNQQDTPPGNKPDEKTPPQNQQDTPPQNQQNAPPEYKPKDDDDDDDKKGGPQGGYPYGDKLPPGYPADYKTKVKLPFPRRNFTCSASCSKTCQKQSLCLAKDYFKYSYSIAFMISAPKKVILSAILVAETKVLDRLDDHISCSDMMKILYKLASSPMPDQLETIAMTDLDDLSNLMDKARKLPPFESKEDLEKINHIENITEIKDIKSISPFLHILKDKQLSNTMRHLSVESKKDMCRHLKYLDCRVQSHFLKEVDLQYCLEKVSDVQPSVSVVRNYLYDRDGHPSKWNDTVWQKNAMGFMPIMIDDKEFVNLFPDMLIYNMLSQAGGCGKIEVPEKIKQMIKNKLKRILKQSKNSTITQGAVELLQTCGGHIQDMMKYATDDQILNSFDSSKAKISGRDKAAMRKMLKKEMSDASQWTKEEIVKFASLIMNDKKVLKELNKTALEGAICDIGSRLTDVAQARKLKAVLITLDKFKDLTTYTKDDIVCLKKLLGTLSPSEVGDLPTNALKEAIDDGDLNDVTFSCGVASSVLKKYYEHADVSSDGLTSSQLMKLPDSIKVCLKPADISKIASDQLTMDVIMDLEKIFLASETQVSKGTIRKIIQKVKDNSDIISALAKTTLGEFIPPSLLKQSVDVGQEIADQLTSGEALTYKADCKKAKYMYGELVRVFGMPSVDNFNWTTEIYKSLKTSNILSGMPLRHLKEISDEQMFEIADSFLASKCITGNQKKVILKKYNAVQKVDSTTVTSEDIQNMDPEILFNQEVEKLKKYGESHHTDICKVIGQINPTEVSMAKILRKAEFCPECTNVNTITSDNVTDCGALMCGLPLASLDSLEADALTTHAESLAINCHWDHTKRRKLVELALEKGVISNPDSMTDLDLSTLRTLVADLTADEINDVPAEAFSLAENAIVGAFRERDDMMTERIKKGFHNDFSDEELNKHNDGILNIFKRIIQIKLLGGDRRRKRSTYTLTCDDLKSLGLVGLPAVSAANLNAVDDTEFQDCLSTLGQVTGWSTEQKATLAAKMESVYGTPSTWTSGTISTAGTIIQGLNATDLDTLQIDLDSISVLGQIAGWTEIQLQSGYKAFMTHEKSGGAASTLTSDELTALANFLCGMSATEIATITPSAYLDAADAVGSVPNCEADQIEAMATVAKHANAFGSNVTGWDEVTISSVGVAIGGLPKEDIIKLSAGQIDSISPNSIGSFPPLALSYFTAEQLGYFSTPQAQATTPEQREHLSYKQFMSLQAAADTKWSSAPAADRVGRLNPVVIASFTMSTLLWIIIEYM